MNDMAKVTRSAHGQAVELPEGYRFDGEAVRISREGDRVVLEPAEDVAAWTPAEIDRLAQAGIESGPDEPWDIDAIRRDVRAMLGAQRAEG